MIFRKFVVMLIIMSMLILIVQFRMPEVSAYTLTDLESQINLAIDWIDRLYYEINSTHAVCLAPFIIFRIKHSDGKWTVSGKQTNTNLPSSATMIRGGCVSQETNDLGYMYSRNPKRVSNYLWDLDADGVYDDATLYVEMGNINDTFECIYGRITLKDASIPTNTDLYLGTEFVIDNIAVDKTFYREKQWGWIQGQYHIRPFVKDLADLYYNLGTKKYSWLGDKTYAEFRGINYTDKAKKLYKTWYGSGYIIGRFDGIYNVTLLNRPFAEIHGGIPPDPDLIGEPLGLPTGLNSGPYINDSNKIQYWVNYVNYTSSFSPTGLVRQAMASRAMMPDDKEWDKTPFICTDTQIAYPYRSRTAFTLARNVYIANGFREDLINYMGKSLPVPGEDYLIGIGSDTKMTRVCMDMYKYGTNIHYGFSKLKEMIDTVPWDGYGIPTDSILPGIIPWGWNYPSYATHVTVPYLNALIQYYKLTGDTWYANRADEVASVLLRLQCKVNQSIFYKNKEASFYFPSSVGSFIPGYNIAYSFGFGEIMWEPYTEAIFGASKWLYDVTGGTLGFASDMFPHFSLGSPESTIPALWTLIEYRSLNRVPPVPTAPEFVFPLNNCTVYTDHGGSLGGDGNNEICSDKFTSQYIGGDTGNLWKYTGKVEKFRMWANGEAGEGWSTIEYVWNFSLAQGVYNWRTKVCFSIPSGAGATTTGNSLGVRVALYNSLGTPIINETRTAIDHLGGNTKGIYAYDNMTKLSYLNAGNYTIKLRFRCHAGQISTLYLGFRLNGMYNRDLPMGLEFFGCNWGTSKYEYYNREDDYNLAIYEPYRHAQTFTVNTTHTITSVKLLMYRLGNPGTLYVSIKATDANGHPTGVDLTNGTIGANSFTTTSPGLWYEITLTEYTLSANTKYAIVCRKIGGSSTINVRWRADNTSPTYAGGNHEYTDNSGSTWQSYLTRDAMFQVWGNPP